MWKKVLPYVAAGVAALSFAACGPKEYPAQGDCNLTVFQQEWVRFCPDSIANYTAPDRSDASGERTYSVEENNASQVPA